MVRGVSHRSLRAGIAWPDGQAKAPDEHRWCVPRSAGVGSMGGPARMRRRARKRHVRGVPVKAPSVRGSWRGRWLPAAPEGGHGGGGSHPPPWLATASDVLRPRPRATQNARGSLHVSPHRHLHPYGDSHVGIGPEWPDGTFLPADDRASADTPPGLLADLARITPGGVGLRRHGRARLGGAAAAVAGRRPHGPTPVHRRPARAREPRGGDERSGDDRCL